MSLMVFAAVLPLLFVFVVLLLAAAAFVGFMSTHKIGPGEVGLVNKVVGASLADGQLIATEGQAGYQLNLLMPGLRFKLWPFNKVETYPWVQVPPGNIGVVLAQVGEPLPNGAKSAAYKDEFGSFVDVTAFLRGGGQRGVQRPVLPPGTTVPIHPIAFVVLTGAETFGEVLSDTTRAIMESVDASALQVTAISPRDGKDYVGVVTTLDGPPSGEIASRIGGFSDISEMEASATPSEIIQRVLQSKNNLHNNYQDFSAFLASGGCIGLQHDPLLYGSYLLNPFLVQVQHFEMLVIEQGQVAVIKSYVGLPTVDTSGEEFKFGAIVRPGHQGIWSEPLRTGKYPLNPRIYREVMVPTSILTLNWSEANSEAHNLDSNLSAIAAKSRDAFPFAIDLQVQIHVPDTQAPRVISMVGTMENLVNEVLQSAVGNHFRNKLQTLGATEFIEERDSVQAEAQRIITEFLKAYHVETRGVYIQDVVFPPELVAVLTEREIASQQKATYAQQREAEIARVEVEKARGIANKQGDLASASVQIEIETANASAMKARVDGQASVIERTGIAEATAISARGAAVASAEEALGLAKAAAYQAQKDAIGGEQTALVAVLHEIGAGGIKITPDIMAGGGEGGIGNAVAAMVAQNLLAARPAVVEVAEAPTA
jgi:uncharacterized membrane protein YqiK